MNDDGIERLWHGFFDELVKIARFVEWLPFRGKRHHRLRRVSMRLEVRSCPQ